jgi:hypothetical protein
MNSLVAGNASTERLNITQACNKQAGKDNLDHDMTLLVQEGFTYLGESRACRYL